MKRSRRVLLTMMGTAAIGAVSMGFVRRGDCGPGLLREVMRGPDGRLVAAARPMAASAVADSMGTTAMATPMVAASPRAPPHLPRA